MAMSISYSLWATVFVHLFIFCCANRRGDIESDVELALQEEFSSRIDSLVKDVRSLQTELPILENRILERIANAETSFRSTLFESLIPSVIEVIVNQTLSRFLDVSDKDMNSEMKRRRKQEDIENIRHLSGNETSLEKTRDVLMESIQKLKEERLHLAKMQVGNMKELVLTKQNIKETDLPVYNISKNTSTEKVIHDCSSLTKDFVATMKTINRSIYLTNIHLKTISNRLNTTSTSGQFHEIQIQNDVSVYNEGRLNSSVKNSEKSGTSALIKEKPKDTEKRTSENHNPDFKGVPIGDRVNGSARQTQELSGPDEELRRILVIPRATQGFVQPHLIHVNYNTFSVYRHLRTSRVNCATYDPTSNRIVFSRYRPYGIFSSKIGVERLEILRDNVGSAGMAVDAGRKLIFMTTLHPRKSISKMGTDGKHFRGILDLDGPRSHAAFSLAIDERREVIYFCQFDRLVSIGYDGNNLEKLESGRRRLYAVAFDPVADCLYFSQNRRVIRKNLKNGENSDVIEVDPIWKILLFNGSLYMSSYKGVGIDMVNINPGRNVHFNLRKMSHNNNDIVLIP